MYRLIYRSTANLDLTPEDIADIVTHARQRNEKDEITGLLLLHKNTFFQVLEGDRAKVLACFQRVSRDRRHSRVIKISERIAKSRAFSTWFMGYENLRDVPLTARSSALSIREIERRLEAVGAMEDVGAGKKILVQHLSAFLHEAA